MTIHKSRILYYYFTPYYLTIIPYYLFNHLECPSGYQFIEGYSNALNYVIIMMRHAHGKEECATFCHLSGQHCHSILWNKGQASCILDNAGKNDIENSADWIGWITCLRGKHVKCHIMLLCYAVC